MVAKYTPPTGYSYIRFSSPEQEKGTSLWRQGGAAEWCKRNKVHLDTKLKLRDLGVTGFTGQHHSNPDRYALAAFLELVRKGQIPRDSYLIVENLDRLSREHIRYAVPLVLEILNSGVSIVTLDPEKVYKHDKIDQMEVMIMIVELTRGHGESERKSAIGKKNWRKKKDEIVAGTPITKSAPFWLRVVDGGYKLIPERAAVVRRVFKLALEGNGCPTIARILNEEGVTPFREVFVRRDRDGNKVKRKSKWTNGGVGKLLRNVAVTGVYQPMRGNIRHNEKRVPDGPPVPDHYPQVVTPDDFETVQSDLARRRIDFDRSNTRRSGNLFTSLVRDCRDQDYYFLTKKSKTNFRFVRSTPDRFIMTGIEYRHFEAAILDHLGELTPADIIPKDDDGGLSRLQQVRDQLTRTEDKIREIQEQIDTSDKPVKELLTLLTRQAEKRDTLLKEYADAQREVNTNAPETLTTAQTLMQAMREAKDPHPFRLKLRAQIARLVERIDLWTGQRGRRTAFWARMHLKTGVVRDVIAEYMQGKLKAVQFDSGKLGELPEMPKDDSYYPWENIDPEG